MAQTVTNVSAGKPAAGGALSVGATTATLPTSVSDTLTGFTSLGYISDDGLTNANSVETDEIKAWGGDTVLQPQTGKTDTFQCTLIEPLNVDVLKEIYGASHVSGTLATGITVQASVDELTERAWVVDMIMRGNVAKRVVIPLGKITELGDIVYKDNEAVGYEVTITAFPDTNGNTHYEYIKALGESTVIVDDNNGDDNNGDDNNGDDNNGGIGG